MINDYRLTPVDATTADALRSLGGELYVADTKPGYPCRQCLCDAEIGETLVLVAHDPFDVDSPYRSRSPIFLHQTACTPPATDDAIPEQLLRRQLSVRAFDDDAMMIDAAVVEGDDLDELLRRFFDDDATHEVHIHNADRGCWAVRAERAPSPA